MTIKPEVLAADEHYQVTTGYETGMHLLTRFGTPERRLWITLALGAEHSRNDLLKQVHLWLQEFERGEQLFWRAGWVVKAIMTAPVTK